MTDSIKVEQNFSRWSTVIDLLLKCSFDAIKLTYLPEEKYIMKGVIRLMRECLEVIEKEVEKDG